MNVHICTPYDVNKNLGKVYNETMQRIPDGDAACLIDYDVQLLTPDAGKIIHDYANKYPNALLTCFTNRVSPLSKMQLLTGRISDETDIRTHIELAEKQKEFFYKATRIQRDISGMLMVLPKKIWAKHPFPEDGKCLGIDTNYGRRLRKFGVAIYRMDGLYCFHQYRLLTGISNKTHLV